MKEQFDSYCGLYCGACSTPGCNGCKILNENHWDPDCKFIKCAMERGIEACAFCVEYPCKDILEFNHDKYIHHSSVVPNGKRIKENGLDAWLDEQKERWTCDKCGTAYTWYESECKTCGSALFNVRAEFGPEG